MRSVDEETDVPWCAMDQSVVVVLVASSWRPRAMCAQCSGQRVARHAYGAARHRRGRRPSPAPHAAERGRGGSLHAWLDHFLTFTHEP